LKQKYGEVIAHIFLQLGDKYLELKDKDIHEVSIDHYRTIVSDFIDFLEQVKITAIPRNTPDGELLTEMS
jgi:hypothetical protein